MKSLSVGAGERTYSFLVVWHAKLWFFDQKLTHQLLHSAFLGPPVPLGSRFLPKKWNFHTINLAQHKILAQKMQFSMSNIKNLEKNIDHRFSVLPQWEKYLIFVSWTIVETVLLHLSHTRRKKNSPNFWYLI